MIALLAKDKAKGVLMAMHDLNLAARFSDTIVMLHHGRIFSSGSPVEVMTRDNIAEVYGVEAVVRQENGYLQIQALHCTAAPSVSQLFDRSTYREKTVEPVN